MAEHTHKQPEDAIEKLCQEKTWEYEISYREEDWLKLKKRLDLLDKQKSLLENCESSASFKTDDQLWGDQKFRCLQFILLIIGHI